MIRLARIYVDGRLLHIRANVISEPSMVGQTGVGKTGEAVTDLMRIRCGHVFNSGILKFEVVVHCSNVPSGTLHCSGSTNYSTLHCSGNVPSSTLCCSGSTTYGSLHCRGGMAYGTLHYGRGS